MEIPVELIYKPVKRIRIEVNKSGVKIIQPLKSPSSADEILNKHRLWIEKTWQKINKQQLLLRNLTYRPRTIEELTKTLNKLISNYAEVLQVWPIKVKLKSMTSRWGSCSSNGSISFNIKLQNLPEELVSYVVVHELAHLKHLNHSAVFWGVVGSLFPEYKKARKQLRAYGTS